MNQAVGISVLPSLSGTARAKRIFSQIFFFSLPNQLALLWLGDLPCSYPTSVAPLDAPGPSCSPVGADGTPRSRDAVMTMVREERASHSLDTGQGAVWEQRWLAVERTLPKIKMIRTPNISVGKNQVV